MDPSSDNRVGFEYLFVHSAEFAYDPSFTAGIFVGGSGREISRVVEQAYARLRPGGRLVANVGSIESLSAVHESLQRLAKDVNSRMINIARGTYQLERVRFEAMNPTFLLGVVKPGPDARKPAP